MRLSDVLSKAPTSEFAQVDGFLNKRLAVGGQQRIEVGRIYANYYCEICGDTRTFKSSDKLYCVGVNSERISIDCVIECVGECGSSVAVWYLIESLTETENNDNNISDIKGNIYGQMPNVRVLKRREKMSERVRTTGEQFGDFTELLEKAERAHRDGLGAGAMVYLRKIYEMITLQTADAYSVPYKKKANGYIPFVPLLIAVDKQCSIIPKEFSDEKELLFGELSNVVHGDCDENLALLKFEPLHRLVVGILDNVKNNRELVAAKRLLWNNDGGNGNGQT